MDKYVYLFLDLYLFPFWLFLYLRGKDTRITILKLGAIVGTLAFFLESFFLKDYWCPPNLFDAKLFIIEDFIFGFFVGGISMCIYNFVFKKKHVIREKPRRNFIPFFLISIICPFFIFQPFGFNSMFINLITFLLLILIIIYFRKDLFVNAILSGLLVVVIFLPFYLIFFNLILTDYWDKYWLLANSKFGITFLGNIPLLEILWYFAFGSFVGVIYSFFTGRKSV